MYVINAVLVIALLFIFFLPITDYKTRADEVVRVLRTRAGPDRVGDENPCSRSDRSQPGALKPTVGFAVLGPASCAEPFGFGKRRGERPNRQLHLIGGPAIAGLDSGGSL